MVVPAWGLQWSLLVDRGGEAVDLGGQPPASRSSCFGQQRLSGAETTTDTEYLDKYQMEADIRDLGASQVGTLFKMYFPQTSSRTAQVVS